MPTINGEKYACISCVRGHRVSTCYHADRELKLIPPKGRPVKQCDHCRTARKSKSHHGKCDCGSKKDKKEQDASSNSKAECCCQDGKLCRCSTRSDAVELRMERSLKRPNVAVKSKPAFTKSQSEDKLLHVVNGHHKPCHRNNHAAHTSGQPYPITRPHSHHGQSTALASEMSKSCLAEDDGDSMFPSQVDHNPSTITEANEDNVADEIISYDFDKHFSSSAQPRSSISMPVDTSRGNQAYDHHWTKNTPGVTTNNQLGLTIDTSPNFLNGIGFPLFSPADLPLISPQVTNFNQTISHSSDFTNESAWTADNYILDGQVAVQDSWPDINNTMLDEVLKTSSYSEMPPYDGSAQATYMSMGPRFDITKSQSPTKTEQINNSMIIPADPNSPAEEAVEDWWPQNSFASQASVQSSSQLGMQQSLQPSSQPRSPSADDTNCNANYDWLY